MSLTHTPSQMPAAALVAVITQTPARISLRSFHPRMRTTSWLHAGYLPSLFSAVILNPGEISKPLMAEHHLQRFSFNWSKLCLRHQDLKAAPGDSNV